MPTTMKTRADQIEVTNILSEAFSVTLPADADARWEPIYPEKVDRLGFPLAELQKVEWEVYPGVFGPSTLLKEVEYSTAECGECGGEGWHDEHGDVICDDCGLMLNEKPMMIPYDPESGRCNGGPAESGRYVRFNDVGKPAINQNAVGSPASEPDVQ